MVQVSPEERAETYARFELLAADVRLSGVPEPICITDV
jgi:hypothetical protein